MRRQEGYPPEAEVSGDATRALEREAGGRGVHVEEGGQGVGKVGEEIVGPGAEHVGIGGEVLVIADAEGPTGPGRVARAQDDLAIHHEAQLRPTRLDPEATPGRRGPIQGDR